MNTLTVNLHLLMATFYRPTPSATASSSRMRRSRRTRTPSRRRCGTTGSIRRRDRAAASPRGRGGAAHRGHRRRARAPARRTSRSCCSAASTTSRASCSRSRGDRGGARRSAPSSAGISRTPSATCRSSCNAWDVDWAAWCHYKYVNAGPGGPGGAFVHERHASDASLPRLAGWWGNDPATRFRMEPGFVPRAGRGRLAGLDAAGARLRAAARVARAVRRGGDAGAARALAAPHRLPRGTARRGRRRAARAGPHATRSGAPRMPAVALRARRAHARTARCGPSTASSATCASPT